MTQHTPGPWTVSKSGSFGWLIRGNWHGEEDSKLAHVDAGICEIKGKFFNENRANAALMGAAPDLLEIAKLFERTIEYYILRDQARDDKKGATAKTVTLRFVRDVIAKATAP